MTVNHRRLNVPVDPEETTYFIVKVFDPGVRPVITWDVPQVIWVLAVSLEWDNQMTLAAVEDAPEISNPTLDTPVTVLFCNNDCIMKIASEPLVTVTVGPTVAKSVNVVDVVVSETRALSRATARAASAFPPVATKYCPPDDAFAVAVSFKFPDRMLS
jgi:hypothetical protein